MAVWETVLLVLAQAAAAVLAVLTANVAGRHYRLVQAPPLRRFRDGFFLLAASQVAVLLLGVLVRRAGDSLERSAFDLLDVLFWAYNGTLVVGLLLVFASFGRRPFRWAPVLAPLVLVVGPVLELLTIVVLFFVVLHAGLNHIARKRAGSVLVAVGFFLIFAAHTLSLIGYSPLEPRWWVAELVNVAGFVVLFLSVRRPRSPDA